MSKISIPKQGSDFHPSRTVDTNWQRRGSTAKRKATARPRCPLFSNGKHRFSVSPEGVRTSCLCGEKA